MFGFFIRKNCWGDDDTIIYPSEVELLKGKIVEINERRDYVHIYVKGSKYILEIGWTYFENWVFTSMQSAKENMLQHVLNLVIKNE